LVNKKINLNLDNFKYVSYNKLFNIEKWKWPSSDFASDNIWNTPFVSATRENNWVSYFIDYEITHKENTISVPSNWNSVWEAYYQEKAFCATWDVNILVPKFNLNKYIWIFIITIIRLDKYRFNYWRKWWKEKMLNSYIKLPVNDSWDVDFEFIEKYIKSLPYSSSL
jgi:hypothetical protein